MGRKVALDCHRRTIYMVIKDGGKQVLRRRFSTDAAGEEQLLAQLRPGDRVVMEATTGVFRLANRVESTGAEVWVLDPQQTRAVGMRGKKTDYRDCLALLEYLDRETMPVVWRPNRITREIRQLTRERFAFNQSLVRMKNRVRGLLSDEGLRAPSAPWEPSGREWLAAQTLSATARRIVERELAVIAIDEAMKEAQEEDLAALALTLPDAQRLMQLTGFGTALAVMWLGEVGDVERFSSSKKLVSYAGMNPSVHQSGDYDRYGPISKAGRSQLRWIMVEVAWRHVHNDGPEAGFFHRLVNRGKLPQVAIVALARRLLVLAYLLLKRQVTHRELDLKQYESKLTRLAACRAHSEQPEPCDRDWAADRVEALTGQVSPRREAGLQRRLRPRPRAKPAAPSNGGRYRRIERKPSTETTPMNVGVAREGLQQRDLRSRRPRAGSEADEP
jgi:transposase